MIDIRIMASPKRADNIKKLVNKLGIGEEQVTWDDRNGGGDAMYTARKAWLHPMPEEATHRLVLQDDVDVCAGFVDIVNKIISPHPQRGIALRNFLQPSNYPNYNNTPYYRIYNMAGCAIIMPKEVIKPCIKWCDESTDEILKPHDDLMISKYCREKNIMMITVLPCIVQHFDNDTLLGKTYNWKRTSLNYDSFGRGDWTNKSILPVK